MILPLLAASVIGTAWAKDDNANGVASKTAEYKRSDANYYLRSDILKANPGAVIIPKSGYTQKDDSYFFTPKVKAPKTLQFEVLNDWIEPITPPDAPPTLSMPPDQMQIREPQGDVTVALPAAPANFVAVADGMVVPNGAVVKTGANSTTAILIGGVDSARLMPNSAAAVQQTVTANSRTAEVDLTSGGVFSKVGQQVGVKGTYEVHTPFGNAVAHGGDFVTILSSNRTDVWIAQGTVSLEPPDNKVAETATSDGMGTLKLLQNPRITDPQQILTADAESLTAIFNFIPMANQKVAALRAKMGRKEPLTPGEQNYLHRLKDVPVLIKLTLVEKTPPTTPTPPTPPTPPPVPAAPAIVKREAAAEGSPTITTTPPAPAKPAPIDFLLGPGDLINSAQNPGSAGTGLSDDQLKAQLADMAKADPKHLVVISKDAGVSPAFYKKVVDACHEVKLKVKVVKAASPAPVAATPAIPAVPATPATEKGPPKPAPRAMPVATTPEAPKPAPVKPAAPKIAAPVKKGPVTVVVNPNGTLKFQGKTIGLAEFQAKLRDLVKATPDQSVIIKGSPKVAYDKVKAVLDSCVDAQVQHVTVSGATPTPPPPPPITPAESSSGQPAANLPAPTLLMHPSMGGMSSNAPPVSPSAGNGGPATNSPPAGP